MPAPEPWLSIVMPVWNGERYLADALESVRREGTEGYEVIAVDDGSSDRSPEILRAWERLLPLRRIARDRGGNWVAATNAAFARPAASTPASSTRTTSGFPVGWQRSRGKPRSGLP